MTTFKEHNELKEAKIQHIPLGDLLERRKLMDEYNKLLIELDTSYNECIANVNMIDQVLSNRKSVAKFLSAAKKLKDLGDRAAQTTWHKG